MTEVVKSVYYDQKDILNSIMILCNIDRFCVDATYGNGSFYKDMPSPLFCFDLDEDAIGKAKCSRDSVKGFNSSDNLPLDDGSVKSFVFDPPFPNLR